MNRNADDMRPDSAATPDAAPDATPPPQASQPPPGASAPSQAPPPPAPAAPPPPASAWAGGTAPGDPRRKSAVLAAVLSCLPGLGQVYTGFYARGFTHILIFAGIITVLANGASGLEPLLGIGLAFFWCYNVIDAARRATLYNQALLSGGSPSDIELPGDRGSFVGGVILIALGVLALLHTRFGFDMYWIEDWWPLGLIGFGAYLVRQDRKARRERGE